MHLPTRDADSLRIAITETLSDLPVTLVRSITWDQGVEMARHIDITADLGAPVYFATRAHFGSAAATERPTACCGNTSRKAPP